MNTKCPKCGTTNLTKYATGKKHCLLREPEDYAFHCQGCGDNISKNAIIIEFNDK